jgi:RimJ/RimL family protein N-acetyltransferase
MHRVRSVEENWMSGTGLGFDINRIDNRTYVGQRVFPSMDVPRIVTDRLILRGFDASDIEAYAALMADPAVTRYLGDGRPLGRPEAWRQLALIIGHWTLRGFGLWAVEERATGALVGRVGCYEPEGWPACEVGYVLSREVWGRGYATEAARAALGYAYDVLARDRVVSLIHAENAASIRVAKRLGGVRESPVELAGRLVDVYAYPHRASRAR